MKNWIIAFLFILSCSSSDIKHTPTQTKIPPTTVIETEVLNLINDYRNTLDLTTLLTEDFIKVETYNHLLYMIEAGEPSHDYFYSRKSNLVLRGATGVEEIVAFGYSSSSSVVTAWVNSEKHRMAIEGNYTHFNISIGEDNNRKYYFTIIFIKK